MTFIDFLVMKIFYESGQERSSFSKVVFCFALVSSTFLLESEIYPIQNEYLWFNFGFRILCAVIYFHRSFNLLDPFFFTLFAYAPIVSFLGKDPIWNGAYSLYQSESNPTIFYLLSLFILYPILSNGRRLIDSLLVDRNTQT